MKKLILIGIGLLLVVGLVAAYKGDLDVTGPNYSEDRHLAMTEAFETGDYSAWVELMTEDGRTPGVMRFVTEENFEEFALTHGEGFAMHDGSGMGKGMKGSGKGMNGQGNHDGSGNGARDGTGMNQDCPYL